MNLTQTLPMIAAVKMAQQRIAQVINHTPLQASIRLSKKFGATILLKREDLQPVRSYKIRGAYNKMAQLQQHEKANGIVCASAGNHAQGVALACATLQVQGTIFMPITTPKQKLEQVQMFGGDFIQIQLTGDTFDTSKNAALDFCEKQSATFIHPFDDCQIIEGQATVGLEILEQSEKAIDFLFVPIGGGGLASGLISVFKTLSPQTKIIGVEPKGAPSMSLSMQQNKIITLENIDRFVDGAAVQQVGDLTFSICKEGLSDCLTIDEGKICDTILEVYNRDAIVVEPAGALSIAALDRYQDQLVGKTVVCVVSGSNNDITRMEEIKERALLYRGLKHYFMVRFPQRPGALKEFVLHVLGEKDDITHFEYAKKNSRETALAIVGIEVSQPQDFEGLVQRMKDSGYFDSYLNQNANLLRFMV